MFISLFLFLLIHCVDYEDKMNNLFQLALEIEKKMPKDEEKESLLYSLLHCQKMAQRDNRKRPEVLVVCIRQSRVSVYLHHFLANKEVLRKSLAAPQILSTQ